MLVPFTTKQSCRHTDVSSCSEQESPKTKNSGHSPLTKQNPNVSCISYKPQRLCVSCRPPGTPNSQPQTYQMPIPLVVTKRHEGQRGHIVVWESAIQINRDPNRDKILSRSNNSRTSKTYRRQDDVFGYKLKFLLSTGVLPESQNLNYKPQGRLSNVLLIHQSRQR